MSEFTEKETLPVVDVFGNRTARAIIEYALTGMIEDWTTQGDIVDAVGFSRQSVHENLGMLVAYGILDVRDADANFPHYRLADTPAVDAIRNAPVNLADVFGYTARQGLVEFFLTAADPDASYSKNALADADAASRAAIIDHVDELVALGVIETVDGTRGTEYRLDTGGDVVEYLETLNTRLYEQRVSHDTT